MKLTVKLYATLSHYLPGDATEHAVTVDVEPDATPFSVIDRFKVPRESAHLVLVNGVYVAPSDRESPVLKEGDTLAVWPPVAGG
mgnify:FL=1|jgi:molybdopterin converting factor small subunit